MSDTPISEILQQFLADNHREDDFKAVSAAEMYMQFVPETCRKDVKKVWCDNGKLFVKTVNAGLRFELMNQRSTHIESLNKQLGKPIIQEIIFR